MTPSGDWASRSSSPMVKVGSSDGGASTRTSPTSDSTRSPAGVSTTTRKV
jgi:hypothetical protein